PTTEEVRVFGETGHGGPGLEPFRVDIEGSQRSIWNLTAADLFAEAFVKCGDYDHKDTTLIAETFIVHIRALKGQLTEIRRALEGRRQGKRKARTPTVIKQGRRRRCHDACAEYKLFKVFLSLLRKLTKEGMSEDESDHEGGRRGGGRRYTIVNLDWRSPEITMWLRMFDLLHLHGKFREDGGAAPGNWPRLRIPSSKSMKGIAIVGLPRNFYNPVWLSSLAPNVLAELKI
ncbi:hypothetical protein BV25DRAFT_1763612, partial [Artomyces pyxidatus]